MEETFYVSRISMKMGRERWRRELGTTEDLVRDVGHKKEEWVEIWESRM